MRRWVSLLIFCCLASIYLSAQNFTTLALFGPSTGFHPNSSLTQYRDGSFYGTAETGGTVGYGIAFKMTRHGTVTVLHNFNQTDGAYPLSGLTVGTDDNLYGTTLNGGSASTGTAFQVTSHGGFTTLVNFLGSPDNSEPTGPLTLGSDGELYGTTQFGGPVGAGTVFRMNNHGDTTIVHSFTYTDGSVPQGGVIQAKDGYFYGTTRDDANQAFGTVFKVSRHGDFTSLYTFQGGTDGADPIAPLVQASDGNFYGTTDGAIEGGALGTVFRITPQGALTTLHSFGGSDGSYPLAALIQATDGNLYGTTQYGGAKNEGTIFRMALDGSNFTTLYSFCSQSGCADGRNPVAGLVQAIDGNFYGTSFRGGQDDAGTAFRFDAGLGLTLLVNKSGNGVVTSSDTYIDCGNTCSAQYRKGYQVILTAVADPGWQFSAWDGCDQVEADACVVNMNGNRTVTAVFVRSYQLSVSKVGNGTVNSADGHIDCGATCSYNYASGTPVTLTATPDPGWTFDAWTGCDHVNGNVCSVTVNSARNLIAKFQKIYYPLTVSKSGNGLVGSGDGHIYCGGACSFSYPDGTHVNLTAVPAAGYSVGSWTGCNSTQGNVCSVVMAGAKNVSASFIKQPTVALISLVPDPVSLKGGNILVATITLSQAAPSGGFGVGISSDHPQSVQPPSLVVVPAGRTSFSFAVRTTPVRSKTVAKITATANASHTSATLTLTTGYGTTKASSQKGSNNTKLSQRGATTQTQ